MAVTEYEQQLLTMISSAGESKAKAFDAIRRLGTADYEGARALLKEAKEVGLRAHKVQTELITEELNTPEEQRRPMSMFMAHAQDHYMSAELTRDLAEALVDLFEARDGR